MGVYIDIFGGLYLIICKDGRSLYEVKGYSPYHIKAVVNIS